MDTYHLPLIKHCVDKSAAYEAAGDKENAAKWFDLAILAEAYYAKQNNQTADEYYKEKNGTSS
jgi:hypothetical protein